MTTEALSAARMAWAHAQIALDKRLTAVLPAALITGPDGGAELEELLTPEQSHEIAGLYGTVVGAWAKYAELLRASREARSQ